MCLDTAVVFIEHINKITYGVDWLRQYVLLGNVLSIIGLTRRQHLNKKTRKGLTRRQHLNKITRKGLTRRQHLNKITIKGLTRRQHINKMTRKGLTRRQHLNKITRKDLYAFPVKCKLQIPWQIQPLKKNNYFRFLDIA